jgi:hypothetical protein
LGLWKIRQHRRLLCWSAVVLIIVLNFVMNAPVYYLFSYIDITGSSTGWHRARLIESTIDHLSEWWLAGTDYTRHWMPTGIGANDNHADITNVYIMMGVIGGLPLMLLFVRVLTSAFVALGRMLRDTQDDPSDVQFLVWTLGAILFGHAMTFFSVDYFDQTIVLYYLALAAVSSLQASFGLRPEASRADAGVADFEHSVNTVHGYY